MAPVVAKGEWLKGSAAAFLLFALAAGIGYLSRILAERLGFVLTEPLDTLRFLPYNFGMASIAGWLQLLASAGLFGMALADSEVASFGDFRKGLAHYQKLALPALVLAVTSQLLFSGLAYWLDWSTASICWVLAFTLAAPFYVLTLPRMIDDNVGFGSALAQSIRLGSRNYLTLLKAIVVGYVRGVVGLILFGVGYLWTMPNYQIYIVRAYRSIK